MHTFDAAMAQKLAALRQVSRHLGMLGHRRFVSPNDLLNRPGVFDMGVGALIGLMEPGRTWWQRAACAGILDILRPGWRAKTKPEILGLIVERDSPEVRAWREAMLTRDGRACRRCGSGERLHAHHIVRWVDVPEARILVDNGITLCEACHVEEHRKG